MNNRNDTSSFINSRKITNIDLHYRFIDENVYTSLIVLYQLKYEILERIIKKKKIFGNEKIIDIPYSSSKFSLEHFIIDNSRYKWSKNSKNAILQNCIYIDARTNSMWGSGVNGNPAIKNLKDKIAAYNLLQERHEESYNEATINFNLFLISSLEKYINFEQLEYLQTEEILEKEEILNHISEFNEILSKVAKDILKDIDEKYKIFEKYINNQYPNCNSNLSIFSK